MWLTGKRLRVHSDCHQILLLLPEFRLDLGHEALDEPLDVLLRALHLVLRGQRLGLLHRLLPRAAKRLPRLLGRPLDLLPQRLSRLLRWPRERHLDRLANHLRRQPQLRRLDALDDGGDVRRVEHRHLQRARRRGEHFGHRRERSAARRQRELERLQHRRRRAPSLQPQELALQDADRPLQLRLEPLQVDPARRPVAVRLRVDRGRSFCLPLPLVLGFLGEASRE
mmetsp:Transcript_12788/g.37575  ORF Transcript_12788/g.37575 Transcript_12788/m.37575 type:complete len:225 (+) Transcript_12788:21-695(+)